MNALTAAAATRNRSLSPLPTPPASLDFLVVIVDDVTPYMPPSSDANRPATGSSVANPSLRMYSAAAVAAAVSGAAEAGGHA